jgi:hypothetical protein
MMISDDDPMPQESLPPKGRPMIKKPLPIVKTRGEIRAWLPCWYDLFDRAPVPGVFEGVLAVVPATSDFDLGNPKVVELHDAFSVERILILGGCDKLNMSKPQPRGRRAGS